MPCAAHIAPSSGLLLVLVVLTNKFGGRGACRRTDSGQRQMAAGALDGPGGGFLPSRALFCGGSCLQFFLHHQCAGGRLEGASSTPVTVTGQSSHKKLGFCNLQGNLTANQQTSIRTTQVFGTVHRNSNVNCHRSNRQEVRHPSHEEKPWVATPSCAQSVSPVCNLHCIDDSFGTSKSIDWPRHMTW